MYPDAPAVGRFASATNFVLLCLVAGALPAAELPPAEAGSREVISLDAGWRFHLGDEPDAKTPDFDDRGWRLLDVPHDWSIEGPLTPPPQGDPEGGFFAHGISWYRQTFTLPRNAAVRKTVVEFDGVYMNSDVWINGQFLGRRPYGFIGFRYDLTEYLKPDGSPNVLAVRVDDSAEPALRWYAGAGIYRHVRLITTGYTHFRLDGGIRVTTPQVAADQAVVEVEAIVDAHFFNEEERQAWVKDAWKVKPVRREAMLRNRILAPDGSEVAGTASVLGLESQLAGQRATQWISVPRPRLWSAEKPELYRLVSTLELAGRTVDETTTTFGIRRLAFDHDRGLLVNGRPTKLKGFCLHQDAGSFGNAVPLAVWAWRLAQLKDAGCNAIRPSHHPFAPEFYDLCDLLGFYVFDEAFDEWTRDWTHNIAENPRGKAKFGYHLYFNQWHETDLRAMLRRDRNHPSVVLYSIGNEIPDQFDQDGWKLARKLVALCHEEDPTRPATSACDQSFVSSRNGFMDQLDLGGYNYIDRLYGERTYAPEHERFPQRLFLGTETTHAVRYWLGVRDNDYVIGDFVWTGIDYLGEARQFPSRGSGAGILDLAGGRKPSFYQRAAYWRSEPILQLSVFTGERPEPAWRPAPALLSWNWPEGTTRQVRAITNCDEVELLLNGRSLGRQAVDLNDYGSEWTVPFAPGRLAAVGYRAGQKVAESELRTASEPANLQLAPLALPIESDVAVFEITVRDPAGVAVVNATPAITVKVEGAGRLLALDSGDLSYGGLFKTDTRLAHLGRLLVTIQRTGGEVRISATAPQLTAATIRLP